MISTVSAVVWASFPSEVAACGSFRGTYVCQCATATETILQMTPKQSTEVHVVTGHFELGDKLRSVVDEKTQKSVPVGIDDTNHLVQPGHLPSPRTKLKRQRLNKTYYKSEEAAVHCELPTYQPPPRLPEAEWTFSQVFFMLLLL